MEEKRAECILCGQKILLDEEETICEKCLEAMAIEQDYREVSLQPHLTFF